MSRAATVIIALILLACAEDAHAMPLAQLQARSLAVARAAWPDSPCAGREEVDWTGAGLTSDDPGVASRGHDGEAWRSLCRVSIRPGMSEERTCGTLVHELGHLAGREHTATGIMAGDGSGSWPACWHLGTPRDTVMGMLRQIAGGARVTCTPWVSERRRCRDATRRYGVNARTQLVELL